MPFYFQAALDNSPLRSGVNYMALAIPQMVGLLAGGGIVTVWGEYVRAALLVVPRTNSGPTDARDIVCSDPLRHRLWPHDNATG